MIQFLCLTVLVCALSVVRPLSENWQNQFNPRKRLGGPLSPSYVLMLACGNALLAGVAAVLGATCGYLIGGSAWALAWATLILMGNACWLLIGIWQACLVVRRYRHPKNAVSPFWPQRRVMR